MIRLAALFVIALLPTLSAAHEGLAQDPLTVFAAASTGSAMQEAADRFEAEQHIPVRLVLASSGVLARQIDSGAPADLFVSANIRWMDWLAEQGALDGPAVPLLGNVLVLAQPADAPYPLPLDETLSARLGDSRLAIGDPDHVPVGIYARQALESLGLWTGLESRLVRLADARAVVLLVERAEVAAGILYASDATGNERLLVAARLPAGSHAPIVYPAGVIAAGNRASARHFLEFLSGAAAKAIFGKHGFRVD